MASTARLVVAALRLVAAADRRLLRRTLLVHVAGGVAAALLVVAGRRFVADLLATGAGAPAGEAAGSLALLVGVTAAVALATQTQAVLNRLLAERAVRHVGALVLDRTARAELRSFDDPAFLDRLRRAQDQGVVAPLRVVGALGGLLSGAVGALGVAVGVLAVAPLLVPVVAVACLPLWLAGARGGRDLYAFAFGHTAADRARLYLQDVLTERQTAAEVRAYRLHGFLRAEWDRLYGRRVDEVRALARRHLRRSLVATLLAAALTAATFAALVALLAAGRLDAASAVAAAIGAQQLAARLDLVGSSVGLLLESGLFLDDLAAFLDPSSDDDAEVGGGAAPPPSFAVLRAEGVRFRYPDAAAEALRGVDLEVRAGEVVALVGANGAGKTTLAKLLCALYRPHAGRVTWDGVDAARYDPVLVRDRVAVVFQDFARYALTAADNIAAGRPEARDDRARVVAAAEAAGASFLAALPDGYDTMLGREFEGGVDLSGGQWQRVALARAFFRDAPFVVLDEPTSASDPRSEADLFARIRELYAGRAVLLVSHRFSTVRGADRIYVLDEGRVVEHGTHDDLVARGGRYAEMFALQSALYLDPR